MMFGLTFPASFLKSNSADAKNIFCDILLSSKACPSKKRFECFKKAIFADLTITSKVSKGVKLTPFLLPCQKTSVSTKCTAAIARACFHFLKSAISFMFNL
jgi:hypothetical protein